MGGRGRKLEESEVNHLRIRRGWGQAICIPMGSLRLWAHDGMMSKGVQKEIKARTMDPVDPGKSHHVDQCQDISQIDGVALL